MPLHDRDDRRSLPVIADTSDQEAGEDAMVKFLMVAAVTISALERTSESRAQVMLDVPGFRGDSLRTN